MVQHIKTVFGERGVDREVTRCVIVLVLLVEQIRYQSLNLIQCDHREQ